jgi:hypothetical protein
VDKVRERADDFDILHFHIDYLHFPLFRSKAARTVTTLHGRQDLADHLPFYHRFSDMPLISISNAQRTPLRVANFVGTVHHGLPLDLHKRLIGLKLSDDGHSAGKICAWKLAYIALENLGTMAERPSLPSEILSLGVRSIILSDCGRSAACRFNFANNRLLSFSSNADIMSVSS